MIEHAVPQNVTTYQFHLIGNMTIKQFLLLMVGVGAAALVYTTNLPAILKWPVILVLVIIGVAMAFVPFEERSLDQWMINFARAMYRPTKFFWRRLGPTPDVFNFTPRSDQDNTPRPQVVAGARRKQVNQYLSTIAAPNAKAEQDDPLDLLGRTMSNLDDLFASVDAAKNVVPGEEMQIRPSLQTRSRPLGDMQAPEPVETIISSAPTPLQGVPAPIATPMSDLPVSVPESNDASVKQLPEILIQPIPVVEKIESVAPPVLTTPVVTAPFQSAEPTMLQPLETTDPLVPITFNRNLPFPSLPDKPNILIGMVYDQAGAILPNAILEVINGQGNTARALRTNALGQFYTSTPLPAGQYIIEVEKDGYKFPRFQLMADDNLLDPIEIRPAA